MHICRSGLDDGGIIVKEGTQLTAGKEGQQKHDHAEGEGYALGDKERADRPFRLSCAHVLSDKSGQCRHKCHRHNGQEHI